jgi:hypothetical protein
MDENIPIVLLERRIDTCFFILKISFNIVILF